MPEPMEPTPGPWTWRAKSGSLHRVGTPPYAFGETVLAPVYEHDTGLDVEVSEANAHLIAAAPDMRDALDSIAQYGSDTLSGRADGPADAAWYRDGVREMTKRARAALLRASGRQGGVEP